MASGRPSGGGRRRVISAGSGRKRASTPQA
jgi:hypothetical protein